MKQMEDHELVQEIVDEKNRRIWELEAEVERLKQDSNEETDQFNAGFEAAREGVPYKNMPSYEHDHDTWGMGYAWGAFEQLRAEIERLKEIERKAIEQSEYIQREGLSPFEKDAADRKIARLEAENLQLRTDDERPE